ncbi:MAG: DegT/DnrJ/EryC1/StrS family aminotransferase, partial [Planctomycetota bacterium]
RVANEYTKRLMDWPDVSLPSIPAGNEDAMSWFVFVVKLNNTYTHIERDRIIEGLRRHDVGASNYFPCIHLQPFYRREFGYKPGDFPIAESISQRTIALPFFNHLDDTRIELVTHTLKVMLQREQLLKRA